MSVFRILQTRPTQILNVYFFLKNQFLADYQRFIPLLQYEMLQSSHLIIPLKESYQ